MSLWGKVDTANAKPKFLTTAQKAEVFFVDITEARSNANQAKGINTPGWVRVKSYDDAQGTQRHKVEVLVAMSVTAVAAGDAADDLVVGDAALSISTQPASATVVAPAATSFSVVASDMGGSFQWQVKVGNAQYANVTNAGVYSGATTATLAISNSTGLNGNKYRVLVLNTAGNTSVTSKPATLTVTE
jgi:hypothetical protein